MDKLFEIFIVLDAVVCNLEKSLFLFIVYCHRLWIYTFVFAV